MSEAYQIKQQQNQSTSPLHLNQRNGVTKHNHHTTGTELLFSKKRKTTHNVHLKKLSPYGMKLIKKPLLVNRKTTVSPIENNKY